MKNKQISSLSVLLCLSLIFACNKEEQINNNSGELYHGYITIGCELPPYYLNIDSLITNCSISGPLPDSLPLLTYSELEKLYTPTDSCLQSTRAFLQDSTLQEFTINYSNQTVDIQSTLLNTSQQAIPIELDGVSYQAGEHPYLGGYIFRSTDITIRLQVVNLYIGGCFHNAILWEINYL